MVFPLYDENPLNKPTLPWVTWSLIALNVVVYVVEAGGSEAAMRAMVTTYGATPSAITRNTASEFSPYLTLVTSIFLHGSFMHLLGNMVFLWVFGDDIEEALGRVRFIIFYLLSGAGATLAFVLSTPDSTTPLVGASGAIAGVLAAYLMLRPCAKVTVLVVRFVVRVSAYWVIGGWALWQIVQIAVQTEDEVAYMAHLGGLLVGAVLFPLIRPEGVKLFECIERG